MISIDHLPFKEHQNLRRAIPQWPGKYLNPWTIAKKCARSIVHIHVSTSANRVWAGFSHFCVGKCFHVPNPGPLRGQPLSFRPGGWVDPGLKPKVWSNPDPNHGLYSLSPHLTNQIHMGGLKSSELRARSIWGHLGCVFVLDLSGLLCI